jgi:Fe2+ or Zn2+ uptake regulation protein
MDVMDEGLNRLDLSNGQARGFHVVGHRVEFHGYCASCRQTQHDAPPRRG